MGVAMKLTTTILLTGCIGLAATSCDKRHASREKGNASTEKVETAVGEADVHTITLPRFQPDLPQAPGREAFAVACISCHSTRYITMQPTMTAARWEESVR